MPAASPAQVLAFFFRPQGRIGRTEYALGIVFVYAVSFALMLFVLSRFGAEGGPILLAMVVTLPLTVAAFVIVAKRCHDLGLPGTFLLLVFVPMIGVIWLIALAFIPGTAGPNVYGAAPRFLPG